jgi:hypothetical protein
MGETLSSRGEDVFTQRRASSPGSTESRPYQHQQELADLFAKAQGADTEEQDGHKGENA